MQENQNINLMLHPRRILRHSLQHRPIQRLVLTNRLVQLAQVSNK